MANLGHEVGRGTIARNLTDLNDRFLRGNAFRSVLVREDIQVTPSAMVRA
jgi:hypothetical protein